MRGGGRGAAATKGATRHKLLALATRTRQTQRERESGGERERERGGRSSQAAGVKCLVPPPFAPPPKRVTNRAKADAPCQFATLQGASGGITRNRTRNRTTTTTTTTTLGDRSAQICMQTHARNTPPPTPTPPTTALDATTAAKQPELAREGIDSAYILYSLLFLLKAQYDNLL